MKIAVLANGAWDPVWGGQILKTVDFLICADGGANYAVSSGYAPNFVIGDLDSILAENLKQCEKMGCVIERYPCQKDETDLELALSRAEERARFVGEREIWLFGATGNRIDHFMGNLALMLSFARKGLRIRLVDPEHEMWIFQGREKLLGFKGQEISLIPLSERAVITTKGLFYPLEHEVIFQESPRGISNVFVEENAVVEVHEGWVLVILLAGGRA
ncbi:MAG: thiamine diphosphokinase [Bacillota bacterium]|nr:thiamine diphosphokinase [Bacillota bacterium]MDP4159899.1 thiamine diphosphokinase [Bacillota bacterium]